jgi:RNA polymerase sigma-70 factor (ECF subfamily)
MENERYNEIELIKALQAGSIDAFDAIFARHSRRLYVYVLTMIKDRAMAEEIVQDCFLELIRRADSIKPSMGVGAWLTRVARNRVVDAIRHREYESSKIVSMEVYTEATSITGEVSPRDEVMIREREQMLEDALRLLPYVEREVLVMRYYAGLKFQEIAKALRRPLGTVLWLARRGLARLAKELKARKEREE